MSFLVDWFGYFLRIKPVESIVKEKPSLKKGAILLIASFIVYKIIQVAMVFAYYGYYFNALSFLMHVFLSFVLFLFLTVGGASVARAFLYGFAGVKKGDFKQFLSNYFTLFPSFYLISAVFFSLSNLFSEIEYTFLYGKGIVFFTTGALIFLYFLVNLAKMSSSQFNLPLKKSLFALVLIPLIIMAAMGPFAAIIIPFLFL